MPHISIARPLYEELSIRPFSGQILGLFNPACNLIDADQRVITLTSPAIGNGPFSIVIHDIANFADLFECQQPVFLTHHDLTIDEWHINLEQADIWEPKINWPQKTYVPPSTVINLLKPYTNWPHLQIDTPAAKSTARLCRRFANELAQALVQKKNIEESVSHLAGLGSGLTPAGDDYLVGVMAALWLTGHSDLSPKIAQAAIPRTTALSRAYLKTAARGEFVKPWHNLVRAILANDIATTSRTIRQIAQFGASSGVDALAGFATTLVDAPSGATQ